MCRCMVVLLLMVVTILGPATCLDPDNVIPMLKLGRTIVMQIAALWSESGEDVVPAFMREKGEEVWKQISSVSKQLSQMQEQQTLTAASIVNTILSKLPEVVRLELKMDSLFELMGNIDRLDKIFKGYIEFGYNNETSSWALEQHTLEDFISHVVSHDPSSVGGTLGRIHRLIVPNTYLNKGLFEILAKQTSFNHTTPDVIQQINSQMKVETVPRTPFSCTPGGTVSIRSLRPTSCPIPCLPYRVQSCPKQLGSATHYFQTIEQ